MRVEVRKQLRSGGRAIDLDIKFELKEGRSLALYGPSGAGKTSVLRMIAGLSLPDDGFIQFKGQTWYSRTGGQRVSPAGRGVGFVFQDYALFPHLTAAGNLRYACPDDDPVLISNLLDLFELTDLAHQHPPTLSGGQQQRVALARALAQRPALLLLDEPLSALDDRLRNRIRRYLRERQRRDGLTMIVASHDRDDLLALTDRIAVLEAGRVSHRRVTSTYFEGVTEGEWVRGVIVGIEVDQASVRVGGTVVTVPDLAGYHFTTGDRVDVRLVSDGVEMRPVN